MSTQHPAAEPSEELQPAYDYPTPRALCGSFCRERQAERTAVGAASAPREADTLNTRPARIDRTAAAAYLRRLPGTDRDTVHQVLTELVAFTAQRGLALTAVHYEPRPSERLATWAALITNCHSEGIANIVVPNPDHFHHDPEIAAFMREELAEKIRGTVWYASEATTTTTEASRREH